MSDLQPHPSKRNPTQRTNSIHGWLALLTTASVMFVMGTGVVALHPKMVNHKLNVGQTSTAYTKDQIVGIWTLNEGIKRRSHNRLDGTASLNVTFDFLTSFIYGTKLNMETNWTLEGDVLTYTITSGEPASSYNRLTRDFGKVASYRIIKLTEKEMLLQELHGEDERYLWKRES